MEKQREAQGSQLRSSSKVTPRKDNPEERLHRLIDLHNRLREAIGNSVSLGTDNDARVDGLRQHLLEMRIEGSLEECCRQIEGTIIGIHPYSQRYTSSQWCSQYHHRLPRELRDMIYSYLLVLDPIYVIKYYLDTGLSPYSELFEPYSPHTRYEYFPYLDYTVVGMLFLTELMTVMYKETTWEFRKLETLPKTLMRTDFGDVGLPFIKVQPWANIQHCKVWLYCERNRENLIARLKPLEAIECKTAIELMLRFSRFDPREVLGLLVDIAPWIFEMKKRGYQLKVKPLVYGLSIDFMKYMGGSIKEFEEWKSTWPESESDLKEHEFFFKKLSAE